jgi:hypothetical protein
MATVYYGAYDQDMTPIGLFRVITDDEAKTQDMEYMNAQGAWVNDPTVIDELREPGVEVIQASEVEDFADALVGGAAAQKIAQFADEKQQAEDQAMPIPGKTPPAA